MKLIKEKILKVSKCQSVKEKKKRPYALVYIFIYIL